MDIERIKNSWYKKGFWMENVQRDFRGSNGPQKNDCQAMKLNCLAHGDFSLSINASSFIKKVAFASFNNSKILEFQNVTAS